MDKNLQAATEHYSENRVQVKFQYSYSSKHMAKLFLKKFTKSRQNPKNSRVKDFIFSKVTRSL